MIIQIKYKTRTWVPSSLVTNGFSSQGLNSQSVKAIIRFQLGLRLRMLRAFHDHVSIPYISVALSSTGLFNSPHGSSPASHCGGSEFNPRAVFVRFMVDKVSIRQFSTIKQVGEEVALYIWMWEVLGLNHSLAQVS
jgi:hypothetical protein